MRRAISQRLGLPGGRPRQRRLARPAPGGRVSRPSGRCGRRSASSLWATAAATFGAERDAILAWLAAARAADFAALAPAVVAAATADDPLGLALLDEGAGHLRRLASALAPAAEAPLCLGGGLADVYRPRLEAALPGSSCRRRARPDPLRGAWLVATGAVPPEYPDVA